MTDPSQPNTYVFDHGTVDQSRLRLAANFLNRCTAAACMRAALLPGNHVLDVGCGPGLALPVLHEMVGSGGLVVGVDASADALAAARANLTGAGISEVELVQADVNSIDPGVLMAWTPFDLALCRLLLTHQSDPAATLRAVARLVRPGGRIVAQDPLRDAGFPRFDPPFPALERIKELDIAHLRHRGLAYDVAWDYAELCAQADLRLIDWQGTVELTAHDNRGLEFGRRLLPAQQDGLVAAGLTTVAEIDELTHQVDAAIGRGVRRSAGAIIVDLIAEVPA
jgi:SAM-dependent methyltransferase